MVERLCTLPPWPPQEASPLTDFLHDASSTPQTKSGIEGGSVDYLKSPEKNFEAAHDVESGNGERCA